ncbi:dihydroorotase [Nitrosomonas eutropha]|uniref:Dihydroorotase n=2 Tax=Nitrosomonas eutropha TaxID=916 RepID=PYRC_NITEC|nr:dihydroorotase [Nitrosomonas eutropha]Q0AFI1.1 RecName: Full=Dihydroorotase; Short=DHOase [Nitrosomonas eutropha C91]ABI59901.1 dihydroorotase [Nitrosomonas eutropha C91]PXV80095.1 dihydroorotase [Nitrosomonas eutropha]SCX21328.1 dihydroorotase [Nitrosomonas eutropha]
MTNKLTFTRPDDWHLHLRDGKAMQSVLPDTARRFARAMIMPNLKLPVVTTEQAAAYRARILSALPQELVGQFEPLMTLYLTDTTTPEEISRAKASGIVQAVKLYPAGATTHSDAGVTDIDRCKATLAMMEKLDMPLLVHGEVVDPAVDIFDREKIFIDRVLIPLLQRFPGLRVVFEHITTREAVEFVQSISNRIAATITAHHLMLNRNALFTGGLQPHHYCLPVLKREIHRQALVAAATSGHSRFFLGTDSAPHPLKDKESACGCAGIYSAHAAIEFYAEIFEQAGRLDRLEAFASFYGPDFYGLPRNTDQISLSKESWQIPGEVEFGGDRLVPLRAGEQVCWRL